MPSEQPETASGADQERAKLLAELLAAEDLFAGEPDGAIPRRDGAQAAPLTFAQEQLWLLDRASPGMTAYNEPIAFRIRGEIEPVRFQRALDELVARHEALRSVFEQSGEQVVQRPLDPRPVPIARRDLGALPPREAEAAALRFLREFTDLPFDLAGEPPFRAALARIAERDHLLLLVSHHIVSDAWSYAVLCRELAALYDGVALAPVSLQMGDYATWQRETMHATELQRRLAFWRERLDGLPVLELPTDRPRQPLQAFSGAQRARVLPRTTLEGVRALARRHHTTVYAVLLAAYQSVLHRYSGQDDIVVGSAVAGRTRSETAGMIGYLSQALPMRTRFDGDPTFAELLGRVGAGVLGALEDQDVPFEALLGDLQRGGRAGDAPLFRVVLTMHDALPPALRFGTAVGEQVEIDAGATKFDLTLFAAEREDGLALRLRYRTDLFDASTAERFLGHLETLIDGAVAAPDTPVSRLPLLASAERAQLDGWSVNPQAFGTLRCVHESFAAGAAATPGAAALSDGTLRLTYAELNARANRLARYLLAHGVRTGTPVGLALERSADAIVALLAILKAGGAYVPLAPGVPPPRLAEQIAEAGIAVVVTAEPQLEAMAGNGLALVCVDRDAAGIGSERDDDPDSAVTLDDLAYVLFTSGSTGVPKGVAVTHRNLANYTAAICARLGLAADRPLRFASVSTLSADLGNTAIFPALCSGGTLHIVAPHSTTEPARFADEMATHAIDVLKITPSHLGALLSGADAARVLPARWLVVGGEACPRELAARVLDERRCRMLNHYGPTETTVGACTFEVTDALQRVPSLTVPIGMPLANVRCYVLDAAQQPVPVGIPGELFIGGAGVARGYVNRPDLSAERFVADPFAGEPQARMYRTGDRVRRVPAGDIEFLGRLDDQVKIRGYRVELGDVEAALAQHPGVAQAVATYREAGDGSGARLVGYATVAAGSARDALATDLRAWVAQRVPDHMVPDAIIVLERMPLTANGKVDRARLPDPSPADAGAGDGYVAPRTPTETAVAALWSEVLNVQRIGVHDAFLALGGHSILAIRLLGKLSRAFGVRVSLRTLFDGPTVAQLSAAIDAARAGAR